MAKAYPSKRQARRPLVLRKCQRCSMEFYAKQSNIDAGKGLFCSQECQRKGRKTRSDKRPRKSYVCKWCGKVFSEDRARSNPLQYCSNKCHGFSKRKGRKEHPRYKQTAALINWARAVILRDRVCVRCGASDNLQAHHVKHYAKYPELRLDVSNGVALCPLCHHAQHPEHKLEWYLKRGGQSIKRCVVCESEYLPRKKTQRTCCISCGQKLRRSVNNGG